MREILTIIACVLVALLTAALIGPYLVDWSAERAFIEHRLSQATGASVHVAGAIDLKLLPTPRFQVENLSAASLTPGGPSLQAQRAVFELAVAPLLRGQIQFTRADIEAPRLHLQLRSDGAVSLPGAPSELPRKLEFESIRIHDATIVLGRGGTAPDWSFDHLDIDAQVASLDGPFSGSGLFAGTGGPVSFRFSTSARVGGELQVDMSVDSEPLGSNARFEGALTFGQAGVATTVAYAGSAELTGTSRVEGLPALPWRISGSLTADGGGAKMTNGEVRLGDEQRGLSAKAQGAMSFGLSQRIGLAFNAQQVDLDSFLASQGPAAREKWTRAFGSALSDASFGVPFGLPVALTLDATTVIAGGETLTGIKAQLALKKDSPAQIAIAAEGPGGSHLAVDGSLQTGPAAALRGRIDLGAKDSERVANWISPEFPDFAARLKAQPFEAMAVAGDLDLSEASFAIRHLVLTAGRTTLRGSASFTRALGVQRARFTADLRSDALDLDALPDLSVPANRASDMDLALSLDARAVRLARFGKGVVDAGHIAVELSRVGSNLRLKNLSISNLGGANFSATGAADENGASFDAKLDAERLADLAALVTQVAPGPFASALAARATALSPARLGLHVAAMRRNDGDYRPTSVSLKGTARGVQVNGDLVPDASDPRIFGLDLRLQGADSSILLRQLGLETLPIADSGKGRIEATLRGRFDQDSSAHVDASLAGADFVFQGQVAGGLTHPSARGVLTAKSSDAAPLLRVLTLALPDVSLGLPVSFASQLQADAGGLSLSSLSGKVGGAGIAGTLRLTSANKGPSIVGSLAIDRLSFGALASLAFGPARPVRPGALWSNAPLAAGLADRPTANVQLSIDRFDLAPDMTGRQATFGLEIESGVVSLNQASMKLGDGSLAGALTLRRNGRAAAIAGKLNANGVSIHWPFLSGRLSGDAQFTATGESALALAQGLAGSGSATVSDLVIPRTDPGALARVIAMSDKDEGMIDQPAIETGLSNELDRAPLKFASRHFDLSAAGGAIHLAAASGDSKDARADISLELSLRALQASERVGLSEQVAPKNWPEANPPSILVRWEGSLLTPAVSRTIDAGGLIGDLSTRAIAHETARIGALDADIRERAFFNRRLKGLRFMQRRQREEAAYEAEQARIASQRARAADAARRAKQETPAAANAGDARLKPQDLGTGASPLVPSPLPPPPPSGFGSDPLSRGLY